VALSAKVSDPVTAPSAGGSNAILTVHFAFGARVAPQVVDAIAKSTVVLMLLRFGPLAKFDLSAVQGYAL
jgi:hypothetical protein